MRRLLPVALVALLAAPAAAPADTLTFDITDGGELAVDFGLLPFRLSSDAENVLADGTLRIVSGPLVDLVVDDVNGFTRYTYGPGTAELDLSGFTSKGKLRQGRFRAPTEAFSIDLCEGCDQLFGGALADDFFIDLGPGRFEAAIASLLGVRRRSGPGSLLLGLEDIDGTPDDNLRSGFDHRGFTELDIEVAPAPIPEPSLLLLAGVAAAALGRRHRRRS